VEAMVNVFQLGMGEYVLKAPIAQSINTAIWGLVLTSKNLALSATIAMNAVVQQHVSSTIQ
jgi:hypothetical protein